MHTFERRDDLVGQALLDLPTPTASPGFFETLRRSLAPQLSTATPENRMRRFRPGRAVALVAAAILASIAAGVAIGAVVVSPTRSATTVSANVLSFEPAVGWNTVETNVTSDKASPQVAWAANVPFKSEDLSDFDPFNTVKALPPDGIVIVAEGPRDYTGGESLPNLELPVQLSEGFFTADGYEGQPAPNVSRYVISGYVGQKLLNVIVSLGSTNPSPAMIDSANAELERLVVPTA
jgi:uncharacterized protein (DUF2237 family)